MAQVATRARKRAPDRGSAAADDWHPADIIAAVKKVSGPDGRPWSMRRLALHHGYAAWTFANVLRWRVSHPVQTIIASVIGKAPEKIWPSRYNPDGSPRSRRGRAKAVGDHFTPTTAARNGNGAAHFGYQGGSAAAIARGAAA